MGAKKFSPPLSLFTFIPGSHSKRPLACQFIATVWFSLESVGQTLESLLTGSILSLYCHVVNMLQDTVNCQLYVGIT